MPVFALDSNNDLSSPSVRFLVIHFFVLKSFPFTCFQLCGLYHVILFVTVRSFPLFFFSFVFSSFLFFSLRRVQLVSFFFSTSFVPPPSCLFCFEVLPHTTYIILTVCACCSSCHDDHSAKTQHDRIVSPPVPSVYHQLQYYHNQSHFKRVCGLIRST